jgi:hypothetical protein
MIELLETRRLFSTVATDEAALTADALAVKADFTTVVAAAKTEATAVALHPSNTADQKRLRAFLTLEARGVGDFARLPVLKEPRHGSLPDQSA